MTRGRRPAARQRGFLMMAGVFLLVVVAGFIAFIATQGNVQQATAISDLQAARAYQAARAGLEWGAYKVLIVGDACAATTLHAEFAGTTLADFYATVSCTSADFTEGASTVRVYQLTSNGCNSAVSCPAAAPTLEYAERQLTQAISKCTANC